jgi:hypothetical protein
VAIQPHDGSPHRGTTTAYGTNSPCRQVSDRVRVQCNIRRAEAGAGPGEDDPVETSNPSAIRSFTVAYRVAPASFGVALHTASWGHSIGSVDPNNEEGRASPDCHGPCAVVHWPPEKTDVLMVSLTSKWDGGVAAQTGGD